MAMYNQQNCHVYEWLVQANKYKKYNEVVMFSSGDGFNPDEEDFGRSARINIGASLRMAADRKLAEEYRQGTSDSQRRLNTVVNQGPNGVVEAIEMVLLDERLIHEAFQYYEVIRDPNRKCENSLDGLFGEEFDPSYLDGKRFSEIFNALNKDDGKALDYETFILHERSSTNQQREMVVLVAVIFYVKSLYKMNLMQEHQDTTANIDQQIQSIQTDGLNNGQSSSGDQSDLARLNELERQQQHLLDRHENRLRDLDIALSENLAKTGVLLQFAILLNGVTKRRYPDSNRRAQEPIKERKIYLRILDEITKSEFRSDPLQLISEPGYRYEDYFKQGLITLCEFKSLTQDQQCLVMHVLNQLRLKYGENFGLVSFEKATELLRLKDVQYALRVRGDKPSEPFKAPVGSGDISIDQRDPFRVPPAANELSFAGSEDCEPFIDDTFRDNANPVIKEKNESFWQKYRKIIIVVLVVLALAGFAVGMAATFGAFGVGMAIVAGCAAGYAVAGSASVGALVASIKSCLRPADKASDPRSSSSVVFGELHLTPSTYDPGVDDNADVSSGNSSEHTNESDDSPLDSDGVFTPSYGPGGYSRNE